MATTKRKVTGKRTAAAKTAAAKAPAKKKAAKKSVAKATKKPAAKKKVNPIPRGYRTVTASLSQADAGATIAFCKKAFGAKVRSKMALPGGKLMHAEVEVGDSIIMVADAMQGAPIPGNTFLYVPDVDKTVAKAVKAGAKAVTPVADMFWGDRFAQLVDPQGNQWAVASRFEVVRPDEMKKRVRSAAKQMASSMA